MRNVTFLLFLSINFCFAQAPNCLIPTPINQEIAHILEPLDKSQIPNGVLYESVFPWAALFDFDGSTTTDTTNTLHFIQAYNEIYNSTFNRTGLIHPKDFEEKLINFHADPTTHHPIGIIDFDYARIKENAVFQNQLSVSNGQLHDVAGRMGSPYETETVFMAVPLLADGTSRFYTNTFHDFYLDSDFILSNNGFDLNDYEYIDIELNGSHVHRENLSGSTFGTLAKDSTGLPKNQFLLRAFRVFFAATAVSAVVITIKLKKKIFGTKISRIDLEAQDLKNLTPCEGQNQIFVTGDSFDGGYGQEAYAAKGRGYIFFGNGHCADQKVRKPAIFVDGFDPNNNRRVSDIWDKRINRSFIENGIEKTMGDSLIKDGFDIIIYDYDEIGVNRGGAGFIENNALAFAKFLDSVYVRYSATMEQDFIIVAPSMASLVVRYALAYMETNNLPHHVQTYISFDGPNQGSQIPLGVQQFVDLITQYGGMRIFGAAKYGFHQSNAAKQMLLHHSYTGSETVQAHAYRQIFLNNLAAVGQYPQNLRKVAIVDGNRSGIKKSTPQPPPNQLILPSGKELELEITKLEDPACTGDCDVVRIKTYAQTDNLRTESIDFKISRKARLFQLVFGGVGNQTDIKRYVEDFNGESLDIAPGGNFGADDSLNLDDTYSEFMKNFRKITKKNLAIPHNSFFSTCFIPTVSAIDFTFPNESYSSYKNLTGLSLTKCAGTIPFDTAYAPLDMDLGHAMNNFRIVNGFRHEIYDYPSNSCGVDCQNYETLTGTINASNPDIYRADKAIFLEPNFSVTGSENTTFSAIIGCLEGQTAGVQLYSEKTKSNKNSTLTGCVDDPFTWNTSSNQVLCGQGFTTFKLFTANVNPDNYVEFSSNNSSWYRANIGDNGYQLNLNANPGQNQTFYAREKSKPTTVIQISLLHCP